MDSTQTPSVEGAAPSPQGTTPSPESTTPEPPSRAQAAFPWILAGIAAIVFAIRQPDNARTIVVFLAILGVLVFVHEWGHYQFARWGGMKVNRFGIGFPPWIYTVRRNNIDYSIGALPIGGMVDIAGLGSEEEMVHTVKGEEAPNPTRVVPNKNVPYGEKQFQEATLGWRFWTLFAGPLMNFIFAIVVFVGVYSFVGLPEPVMSNKVEAVTANTPAARSGLQPGDQLVGVNNQRSRDRGKISEWIRASKGQPITLHIERGGKPVDVRVTPVYADIPGLGKVPSIGVVFEKKIMDMTFERTDFVTAVKTGFMSATGISLQILDTIKRAATRQLTTEEREGIRGPVGIAQTIGESAGRSWQETILLAAMLSVNLGLLNLLPFPALDGGRILFLAYEFVARRPFNPRWEGIVHAVGMVMLLAFMLFITFRDVLIGLNG